MIGGISEDWGGIGLELAFFKDPEGFTTHAGGGLDSGFYAQGIAVGRVQESEAVFRAHRVGCVA